ncbi:MAG TPA: CPBP family intramembrane glutamic endopeptidase [Candidatus Acidoferrum sp.]|nr:CPBP family intramembrane glutamic endopeptidase [Candidatus Acidoferrum sp.]
MKPWKPDAILRLLLSVFVCIFAGSLLPLLWQRPAAATGTAARLIVPLTVLALGCWAATLVLLNRPWRLQNFERRFGALLACFCVGFIAGALAGRLSGERDANPSTTRMIIATLSFQGAGLILIARFLREHQVSWAEGFGLANGPGRALLLGVIIALLFLPIGWGLQETSRQVMTHLPHLKLHPEEQQSVHALRTTTSWADRLALAAAAILLAPVAEEMLFRGVLYPAIKQAGFPHLALWGTSVFFAVVHTNLVTFLPLVVLALALTALYERTNNLLAPITAHSVFNALNFASLLLLERHA